MEIRDSTNNSFDSVSETMTSCLICLKSIPGGPEPIPFDKEYFDMFEVLSKYMQWSPPPAYHFNFNYDPFPFCYHCKFLVKNLSELHEQMKETYNKISKISVQIYGKIMMSQNGGNAIPERQCFKNFNQNCYDKSSNKLYTSNEKCEYYRSLIHKKFTPSVLLALDPQIVTEPVDFQKNKFNSTRFEQDVCLPALIEITLSDDGSSCNEEHAKAMLTSKDLNEDTLFVKSNDKSPGISKCLLVDKKPSEFAKNLWICNFCAFPFSEKSDFIQHVKICPGDPNSFASPPGLSHHSKVPAKVRHTNFHVKCRQLSCNICGQKFARMYSLNRHKTNCSRIMSKKWIKEGLIFSHAHGGEKQPSVAKDPDRRAQTDLQLDQDLVTQSSDNRETLMNHLRLYGNQIISDANSQAANHFTILYDGKYHYGRLSANDQWCCIFCHENFAHMPSLVVHLKTCPGCLPPNNTRQTFRHKGHIYDELVNREYQCRHCMKQFSSKLAIVDHLGYHVRHSNPVRISCTPIESIQNENKSLDCEIVCIIKRPLCCDVCGESFEERRELFKHKASTHSGRSLRQNNFRCKVCEKKFSNLGSLVAHKNMFANATCRRKLNEITCKFCERNFTSTLLLSKHQLTHHKESRPFCCEFCKKSFKSKYAMRMHRAWTHLRNSDKKFACEICGDTFDRLLLLTLHDKIHEKEVVVETLT